PSPLGYTRTAPERSNSRASTPGSWWHSCARARRSDVSRVNRHFRFECIVTAPLCHGGDESAGNVQMFRRIPMIDGSEVPAISANSLRGQLRRITARRLLELIGVESLTDLRRSHLLFSGGAIQKGEIATAHRFADIRDLRDL